VSGCEIDWNEVITRLGVNGRPEIYVISIHDIQKLNAVVEGVKE